VIGALGCFGILAGGGITPPRAAGQPKKLCPTQPATRLRAIDRAERLRKRLGGADWSCAFDGAPLPPKPPRMRWKTYRRLEAQYEELQSRGIVGALSRFGIGA